MKRMAIAIIVAALLLLMMPTAVSAASGITVVDRTGDGNWIDEDTWQVEIFPGEVKSTTLTLYNSSSSSLDVEVSVTPDSLDNGNLTFRLDNTDFTISGRSYDNTTLTVEASGSATPETYTTELTIKSEVPPTPTKHKPSKPAVVEPEEEEPVVPELAEPEPTVPEPEEPTEPEEPEEEEPEVVEPEKEEPEEPVEPEKPELILEEEPCWWSLLDSILAGLVLAVLGLDIWQWQRRKQRI